MGRRLPFRAAFPTVCVSLPRLEPYDIVFNGAAPTRGDFKTSPGRYSGQDNGWIGLYINPVTMQFWDEMKTHPNIPYKPFGAGSYEQIPPAYR